MVLAQPHYSPQEAKAGRSEAFTASWCMKRVGTVKAHKVKHPPEGPGYTINGEISMPFYCCCKIYTLAPRHSELFSSFQGRSGVVCQMGKNTPFRKKSAKLSPNHSFLMMEFTDIWLTNKRIPWKRRHLKPLEVSETKWRCWDCLFTVYHGSVCRDNHTEL